MKKIGIAGAGGIGSNVALHLVRSGVDNLKIVDFDKIEKSNLNRQFYFYDQIGLKKVDTLKENLLRIRPELKIVTYSDKLDQNNIKNFFNDCDIIIEGFDLAEYKTMLINAFANSNKMIISACGLAGLNIEKIKTKKLGKNLIIVGDMQTDIKDKKLYSPKILIAASIMSNLVLKKLGFKDE